MIVAALISVLAIFATANDQSCFCDWTCSLHRDCCPGCQESAYMRCMCARERKRKEESVAMEFSLERRNGRYLYRKGREGRERKNGRGGEFEGE